MAEYLNYCVVRYCPDCIRGEFINVGLVGVSTTGDIVCRMGNVVTLIKKVAVLFDDAAVEAFRPAVESVVADVEYWRSELALTSADSESKSFWFKGHWGKPREGTIQLSNIITAKVQTDLHSTFIEKFKYYI